jgi:hypothetical protein
MNILSIADKIVNERSEEKEREYGPFDESMSKAARIASELCNKEITTDDFFKCMIALKLSRLAYSKKEDTKLDLVAYIAALNNFTNGNKKTPAKKGSRKKSITIKKSG